ncbi:head-tail joining protein [Methylorubrum extorquens]
MDAIWRTGGADTGPVRIRRRSPEAIIGAAGNQFDLDAMLIHVRLSEVAEPAEGDQIDLLDEGRAVTETVQVIGLGLDRHAPTGAHLRGGARAAG